MTFEDKYEERFSYIKDSNLRRHMWDAFRFVYENIILLEQGNHNLKWVESIFYKTCILYTSSIIEAHLNYCLIELWNTTYTWDWKYKDTNKLYRYEENWKDIEVIWCKRFKEIKKFTDYTDFAVLNKFSFRNANLYWEELYNKIDKVRWLRNKVHLIKLDDIDRMFTKRQMNEVFDTVSEIFDVVKTKLLSQN